MRTERWEAGRDRDEGADRAHDRGDDHGQHSRQRLENVQRRTDTSRGRDVDAERPQRAGRVVIGAGDEVGLELGAQSR